MTSYCPMALITSYILMTPTFISPAQIFPNSSLVYPTVSGVPPLGRLNRCLIFNMALTKFLIPISPNLLFLSFPSPFRKCQLHPFCSSSQKSWCHLLLSQAIHLIHQIHHESLILGKTRKGGNLGSWDEDIKVKYK